MKYYILQEDYTEFDPEGRWDGEDYETTEERCRNIVGFYSTLKSAVKGLLSANGDSGKNPMTCWDIHEVDTAIIDKNGCYQITIVPPKDYEKIYDDLSWELARENSWKDKDFEKFDKEFEDKDYFKACCKDCKYRKMVYRGVKTRCVILYEQKTAEKCCMKVVDWLKKNKNESEV